MKETKGYQGLKKALAKNVSQYRFDHTMRVVDLALELAKIHGLSLEKSKIAALLHDYAKDKSQEDLISLVKEAGFPILEVEERDPALLHGLAGAILVEKELGIKDEEILDSIRYHTTGRANFSDLGKLIFIADLLEAGRDYPGLDKYRALARENLDQAYLATINSVLDFLLQRDLLIHPRTIEARNDLLLKKENKKERIF